MRDTQDVNVTWGTMHWVQLCKVVTFGRCLEISLKKIDIDSFYDTQVQILKTGNRFEVYCKTGNSLLKMSELNFELEWCDSVSDSEGFR